MMGSIRDSREILKFVVASNRQSQAWCFGVLAIQASWLGCLLSECLSFGTTQDPYAQRPPVKTRKAAVEHKSRQRQCME